MFGAHYRHGGASMIVVLLLLMEVISILVYQGFLWSEDRMYALMGFVLVSGFWFFFSGLIGLMSLSGNEKGNDETSLPCGVVALIALSVMLVSLGSLIDTPAASADLRVFCWVVLGLFCLFTTLIAQVIHGDMHNIDNAPWPVRWAFTASFLYLPLHLHFSLPILLFFAALGLQLFLGLWLFLRWWRGEDPNTEKTRAVAA
jgi:hypothetical protein